VGDLRAERTSLGAAHGELVRKHERMRLRMNAEALQHVFRRMRAAPILPPPKCVRLDITASQIALIPDGGRQL